MNQELKVQAVAVQAVLQLLALEKKALELPEILAAGCAPFLRNPDDAAKVLAFFRKEVAKAVCAGLREAGLLPETRLDGEDVKGRGRRGERGT